MILFVLHDYLKGFLSFLLHPKGPWSIFNINFKNYWFWSLQYFEAIWHLLFGFWSSVEMFSICINQYLIQFEYIFHFSLRLLTRTTSSKLAMFLVLFSDDDGFRNVIPAGTLFSGRFPLWTRNRFKGQYWQRKQATKMPIIITIVHITTSIDQPDHSQYPWHKFILG